MERMRSKVGGVPPPPPRAVPFHPSEGISSYPSARWNLKVEVEPESPPPPSSLLLLSCQRRHPRLLPPRPRTASALPAAPGSTTAQLPVTVPVAASAALQTQAAGQRVARHQQVAKEVRHGVDPRVLAVVAQPVGTGGPACGLPRPPPPISSPQVTPRPPRRGRPARRLRQNTARRAAPSCLNSA